MGLPDHRPVRADEPLRQPDDVRRLRRRAHAPASASSSTGSRAFPERRARLGALRRHAASTSTTIRARASTPSGARCIFNFGRHEVRDFLVANALFWLRRVSHRRAARRRGRLDDLPRLRPQAGRVDSQRYGGNENLEADRVPAPLQRGRLRRIPGHDDDRRGVDRVAEGLAPRVSTAASASATSGTWAGCTTRSSTCRAIRSSRSYHHNEITFGADLRVHRKLRAAALARRGRARQGLAARARCPATRWQQFANLRLLYGLHVRAPGQEAALHGRRVRASDASGITSRSSTGTCSPRPPHAGRAARSCATQRALPRLHRRCTSCDCEREGFEWIDRQTTSRNASSRACARGATRATITSSCVQLHAGRALTAIASAFRRPARIAKCSTPTPRLYGGGNVGNDGRRRDANRCRRTAARNRFRSRLPPLAPLDLRDRYDA